MKARECIVVSYTYSGTIIDEVKCSSVRKALKEMKELKKGLSCYSVVIYDAETLGIIKD